MKKLFAGLVIVFSLFSVVFAQVDVNGVFEIKYDTDSKEYTAKDSKLIFSADVNKKIDGELVFNNDALDSYELRYGFTDYLRVRAGLIFFPFGEYYNHLISDPLFKGSFDNSGAGWVLECDKKFYKSIGVFNNTSTTDTNADAVAVRVAFPLGDSTIGAGYLKDGKEDIAVNYFGEGIWGKWTVDTEIAAKQNDRYWALGVAHSCTKTTEIALRYESDIINSLDYIVVAGGVSQVIDEYLTLFAEANTTTAENKSESHLLGKASFEF